MQTITTTAERKSTLATVFRVSREREYELAAAIAAGDPDAAGVLAFQAVPMAKAMIRRVGPIKGMDPADLLSAGYVAALEAAPHWRVGSARFSTFAGPYVWGALMQHVALMGRLVSVPTDVQVATSLYARTRTHLEQRAMRRVTHAEVVEALVERARTHRTNRHETPAQLKAAYSRAGVAVEIADARRLAVPMAARLPGDACTDRGATEASERTFLRKAVADAVDALPADVAAILRARFGLGEDWPPSRVPSLKEIQARYGWTATTARNAASATRTAMRTILRGSLAGLAEALELA